MPAQLQFFDQEVTTQAPQKSEPFKLTLGANWQPNDIRMIFIGYNTSHYETYSYTTSASTNATNYYSWRYRHFPYVPDGWIGRIQNSDDDWQMSTSSPLTPDGGAPIYTWLMKRLVEGDEGTEISWSSGANFTWFNATFVTLRGHNPLVTPAPNFFSNIGGTTSMNPNRVTLNSLNLPAGAASTVLLAFSAAAGRGLYKNSSPPPDGSYVNSGGSIGSAIALPTGWKQVAASEKSGTDFDQYNGNTGLLTFGKNFNGGTSTGTIPVPVAYADTRFSSGLYDYRNNTHYFACALWLPPAPDGASTGGNVTSVSSCTNGSSSSSNSPTSVGSSVSSKSYCTPALNPLIGVWTSDPILLEGNPVTSSRVEWDATVPAGSAMLIETSINNGASWDTATNNAKIARLEARDDVTRSVLIRVTMSRPDTSIAAPELRSLEMRVTCDNGVDELVAVGHGVIDKVKPKSTSGSSGGGSGSGVSGGGSFGKGPGQFGGGTSIKVHCVDPSSMIKAAAWEMPYYVYEGTNYGDAVKAMVLDRLPSQSEFSMISTTRTFDSFAVFGMDSAGDPWEDIRKVCAAIGYECFFDAAGVFVFRPIPDPRTGTPVREFDQDVLPTVTQAERELSIEKTFNYIVGKGESPTMKNPISAFWINNDPSSGTYVGRIGKRTAPWMVFSFITDQSQLQEAVDAAGLNSLGMADTVTITIPPDPTLEMGDVIRINVPATGATGTYLINESTLSLASSDAQQLVCFCQTTN